jgi:hypothetical protein
MFHTLSEWGIQVSEQRVTVKEAAAALSISEEAVRQRIRRNRLESEKDEEGRVWVWLDVTRVSEQDTTQAVLEAKDETIAHLSEQLSFLRTELEVWQEEARRKDHLLANIMQRIPELEAAPEPRESTVNDSEDTSKGEVPNDAAEAEIRQSWWKRWFGASASE